MNIPLVEILNEKLYYIYFQKKTLEGYKIIGAGTTQKFKLPKVNKIINEIESISLDIENLEDPVEIDSKLNHKIASLFSKISLTLGLSLEVPDACGPTGGILRIFEKEKNDFSLAGYNGGPGVILKSDSKTSQKFLFNIAIKRNKVLPMREIEKNLLKYNVKTGIIVTDGTGSSEKGLILIYDEGKFKTLDFDRW